MNFQLLQYHTVWDAFGVIEMDVRIFVCSKFGPKVSCKTKGYIKLLSQFQLQKATTPLLPLQGSISFFYCCEMNVLPCRWPVVPCKVKLGHTRWCACVVNNVSLGFCPEVPVWYPFSHQLSSVFGFSRTLVHCFTHKEKKPWCPWMHVHMYCVFKTSIQNPTNQTNQEKHFLYSGSRFIRICKIWIAA